MGRPSLYKKKYAKDLVDGMRRNPKASIERCCQEWGITRKTYYNWIEQYPEFKAAHEMGERDYRVAFESVLVDNAMGEMKGNTGVLQLIAKNVLKWSDKIEVESTTPSAVNKIEVEVLKPAITQQQEAEEQEDLLAELKPIEIEQYGDEE